MLKDVQKKLVAFSITLSLIVLIFLVLSPPPSIAVYLHPGTPSYASPLYKASTVTFNNVNLTIRGSEAIPVNYLNFSIRQSSNHQRIAYLKISLNGTIKPTPLGIFTVTNITNTSNLPYYSSGDFRGYDEQTGKNYNFTYGYGYDTGPVDLTILYTIRYTTSTTGTFYVQLYVNSTNHTYTHEHNR